MVSVTATDDVIQTGAQIARSGRYRGADPVADPWPDDDDELCHAMTQSPPTEEKVATAVATFDPAPPPDDDGHQDDDEPTTWEPLDLAGWISGDHKRPEPSVGIVRSDGQRVIYPGREHAIVGETESGKSWFALGCVATELMAGRRVLYLHYEESDAGSTVERLLLIGVPAQVVLDGLVFVAPTRPVRRDWLAALLEAAPNLVVHDGVNEAMSLHGADIMAADGASTFRRSLVTPCLRAGAATLACDHVPKNAEGRGRDAFGSVHKGNALDGARIVLENVKPFGRGLRGVSYVYVTKDRPGYLRAHGQPTSTPGKTFYGTLVVDNSSTAGPDLLEFFAPKPKDTDDTDKRDPAADLADTIHALITAQPDNTVKSSRQLFALLRQDGHAVRDANARNALDDLLVARRITEVPGRAGSKGYRVAESASRGSSEVSASVSASASASLKGRDAGTRSHTTASDCDGTQWDAVGRTTESES